MSGAPARAVVSSGLAGFRLGVARCAGRPLVLVGLLAAAVSFAISVIEHEVAPLGAIDRSLDGVFRWVVPLVCFVATGMVVGRRRLDESVWCEARFGRPRRWLALGLVGAAVAASGLLALLVVELGVLTASSRHAALAAELWTCGWITLLGTCCYTAWFAAGTALFRSTPGRAVPLLLDFLLGEGQGAFAIPWPRAHLRNLLGGAAPLGWTQAAATVSLIALTAALVALATVRARR